MQNIIVGKNSVIFGKIILYLEMIYGGNMITSMGLLYILFILVKRAMIELIICMDI